MKKILGILFLSLLLSGNSYAKKFVKLSKDVGSGSKFYKSLTGKYYKKYGMEVVNKSDGHPVRSGEKSIRFELRAGDCGKDKDGGWNDCKNGPFGSERYELLPNNSDKDISFNGNVWHTISWYIEKFHLELHFLQSIELFYFSFNETKYLP